MHVAHVVDGLALGGAERMVVELANRSVADGLRASVCVTRDNTTRAPSLDPRVELLVLGRTARFALRPLARLTHWLRSRGVDVVHCHGRASFSLAALLYTARAWRGPILLHDHRGVQLHASVPRWFPLARHALAAYVAVDPAQRAWADRAGIAAARQHVIANALDLAAVIRQPLTGPPLPSAPGPRLIFVGGLRPDKAVDVLLDAVALLAAPGTADARPAPASLFLVGGDGDPAYAAACRARARRADLAGRVVFLGQRTDALPLAATADLAVHSARSESGPLVLAEYAARGVPFVATRVGGVAATLAAAGVGWFVPPDDPRALAAAITAALAVPAAERRRLADTWRQTALDQLDLTAVMPRWYALYRELLR